MENVSYTLPIPFLSLPIPSYPFLHLHHSSTLLRSSEAAWKSPRPKPLCSAQHGAGLLKHPSSHTHAIKRARATGTKMQKHAQIASDDILDMIAIYSHDSDASDIAFPVNSMPESIGLSCSVFPGGRLFMKLHFPLPAYRPAETMQGFLDMQTCTSCSFRSSIAGSPAFLCCLELPVEQLPML